MDIYEFVVDRNGRNLTGVVPGEILTDAVALALRSVDPDVSPERQEWLRGEVAEYMAKDAVTPRYPIVFFQDGAVSGTVNLTRVSGTVPPLQPPPQLARPRVERPAEWEGLLYRQMYRYVRGQIEAGSYRVGDQLPDPDQLAWHFGTTSSNTGRQAYVQLITEGLVTGHGAGRYVVAAMTPPPVQTIEGAVDRLDALEASVNETLVALRRLRGELAGVQTPHCGQWWQVRSLAQGADPVDTSQAVCIRDDECADLQWLACISNTWVRKPLNYFQPLRRLSHIPDWSCQETWPTATSASQRTELAGERPAAVPGAAYYSTGEQHSATGSFEHYGPEQWTEGFFK
ncbi:GntR family transcriptional regulator [Mycolicibacterium sp. Y3]